LLPEISQQVLTRMAQGLVLSQAHVTVDEGGAFQYHLE